MTASDDSPLSELAEGYAAFLATRDNAEIVLVRAQRKLRELYMAAIVPPGGGTGSSNLPLDDADDEARALLMEAEHVAVHGVSVGAVAVSRTSEREIRDYEYSIRGQRRRFEQLLRMRQRGPLGRRPQPAAPCSLESETVGGGDVICALCGRDFWSPIGRQLVVALSDPEKPAVVCWICGDEHAPELTAKVLADAVLSVEQRVGGTADYRDHWVSLLREMGLQQRAIDLEEAIDEAKTTVREMKAAALGLPEAWLEPL
jgi:hypothetical protein